MSTNTKKLEVIPSNRSKYDKPQNTVSYMDIIRKNKEPLTVTGFSFDTVDLENLCSWFVPKKSVYTILQTTKDQLDTFCMAIYHLTFDIVYDILTGVADAQLRNAITQLSKQGNNTALSIAAKHFMNLEEDEKQSTNITIVNDLTPKSRK